MTNTDELRRLLDDEVSQQPRTLIIDLSGLRFMDSSALHALLRVNRSLDRQGGVLALVSPQAAVAKILRLTTADRLIPVFDSVAAAAVWLSCGQLVREPGCLRTPAVGYASPQWCLRRRHAQRDTVFSRSVRTRCHFFASAGDTVTEVRQQGGPTDEDRPGSSARDARCARAPVPDQTAMTSDSASSPVMLAAHGHQVTVFAQKHQPDLPDQAELHDGVRVDAHQRRAGPAGRRRPGRRQPAGAGARLQRPAAQQLGARAPRRRARAALDERAGRPGRRPRPGHPRRAGVQLARGHRTARPGPRPTAPRPRGSGWSPPSGAAPPPWSPPTRPRSRTWPAWACTGPRSGSSRGASTPTRSPPRARWRSGTAGRGCSRPPT